MQPVLPVLLCLALAGCPETMPLVDREVPHRRGNATAAETTLFEATCTRFEECAAAYGRLYDSFDACIEQQLTSLDTYLEAGGRHASDEDADGCTTAIKGVECNRLHTLTDLWESDRACRRVADAWNAPLVEGTVGVGGACLPLSAICEPGSRCARDTVDGPGCWRCETLAGLGDACATAACDTELYCDTLAATPVCATLAGRPCPDGTECDANPSYICDAVSGCRRRSDGDPCLDPLGNRCLLGDPSLVCVQGTCAERSGIGEACDDARDCWSFDMTCKGGLCDHGAGRAEACVDDVDCRGFLVCKGTCTDGPGMGDTCNGRCLLDLDCVDFVCRDLPDTLPAVGIDGECLAVCGDDCLVPVATCETGWCAPAGTNLPWFCNPYLDIGEPCHESTQDPPFDESGCEPGASYCLVSTSPAGTCTAYAQIGGDCTARLCDPLRAYCAPLAVPTCTPLLLDGEGCNDGALCIEGYCYGACTGGAFDGLPCSITADCGKGGICSGTCSGPDPHWTGCR